MRVTIPILLVIISISCNAPVQKNTPGTAININIPSAYNYDTLEGVYSGDFGGNNIRIILSHVTGMHAIGYNLLKGLRRNISGTMKQAGNSFTFLLNEPGDHPYDGKFSFTIDTISFTLSGTWAPLNDKSLTPKTFTLKKLIDTGENRYDNFTTWADSIGNFTFSKNGNCIYEFYPIAHGKPAEQLIRVKGTWSIKDSVYTIDWEANTVFPGRRSIFIHRVQKQDSTDYPLQTLNGEGRSLGIDEF